MTAAEVDVSFFGRMNLDIKEECSSEEDKPLDGDRISDMLIVDHEATWYAVFWKGLTTLCSLTSTYQYAHFSIAGHPPPNSISFFYILACETVFAISIGFKFRLTFKADGEPRATRDPAKIARRYIGNEFFMDLLPLFPFERLLDLGGLERHLYFIKVVRLYNISRIVNAKSILEGIRNF